MRRNTNLFHDAKWGLFMHFIYECPCLGIERSAMSPEGWNALVDGFDAESLGDQLARLGCRYFFLALGQNSGYYCSPNAAFARITGFDDYCSARDLPGDLADALARRGIDLLVYLPANAPLWKPEFLEAFEYRDPLRCAGRQAGFQRKWEAVVREWSLRWGRRVKGWWIDGCYRLYCDRLYRHDDAPNFSSFAAALRAGNPDSLVAFNTGVSQPVELASDEEDYTAGEMQDPCAADCLGRYERQAQYHILTYAGEAWGRGPPRFSGEELARMTRQVTDYGGAVTWDIPFAPDGTIPADFLLPLEALAERVNATRGAADRSAALRPRVIVHASTLAQNDIAYPEADGGGFLRARLLNTTAAPLRGMLTAEGFGGLAPATAPLPYDLPPGASAAVRVDFRRDGPAPAARNASGLRLRVDGETAMERIIPIRPPARTLRDGDCLTFAFPEDDRRVGGSVSLERAGERLLVRVRIVEGEIRRQEPIWCGSCVELFAAVDDFAPIQQWFIAPPDADAPGGLYALDGVMRAVQGATFACSPTVNGYEAEAAMPWRRFTGDTTGKARAFLFEAAMTGYRVVHHRKNLFGSAWESAETACYTRIAWI